MLVNYGKSASVFYISFAIIQIRFHSQSGNATFMGSDLQTSPCSSATSIPDSSYVSTVCVKGDPLNKIIGTDFVTSICNKIVDVGNFVTSLW